MPIEENIAEQLNIREKNINQNREDNKIVY